MISIDGYYGSSFEMWAKKFCYKNHWRVNHVLGNDIEDFYCQCSLWWVECYNFYKESIDSDPLMMHMFKLWITGQVHDLSRKDTNKRDVFQYRTEPVVTNEAGLALKLDDASDELKQVLKIFIDAPKEIMEVLRADCQSPCPKQFFKRVVSHLKLDPAKTPKLAKELQELLT